MSGVSCFVALIALLLHFCGNPFRKKHKKKRDNKDVEKNIKENKISTITDNRSTQQTDSIDSSQIISQQFLPEVQIFEQQRTKNVFFKF